MKKFLAILLVLCALISFAGCKAKRTLHCDACNKEVQVEEDSNMQEEWIIYCKECEEKLIDYTEILEDE